MKFRLALVSLLGVPALAYASGDWFEEAPPRLPFYLHRLPGKTIQQIDAETNKPPAVERKNCAEELQKISRATALESNDALRQKVNDLLVSARGGSWEQGGWWSGPALVNLLHDVRDLFATKTPASAQEISDYIAWRIKSAPAFGLGANEKSSRWEKPPVSPELLSEIEQHLENAPAGLRAHWLYLRGALLFRSGQDTESQRWFEQVLAEFPDHPRAEAALFMDARCQLSRARGSEYTQRDPVLVRENLPRAQELFQTYLAKYPAGDFAGDALGWLGALAFDQRDFAEALKFYVQQTELRDHPELRGPALIMCEKVLSHIASAPDDAAFEEVARHPREAMALLYLIVNTTEADNFNGETDEVATVKEWRKKILPRLARAVAAQKSAYEKNSWTPNYLALLAQAASGAGNQKQALDLVQLGEDKITTSDDLAFARAVSLQRANRLAEAAKDYRAFVSRFPKSPLARGARLRLALTLQDDHQSGAAIAELWRLLKSAAPAEPEDEARVPDTTEAEPAQIRQLIDTLENFAPLTELTALLQQPDLEAELRLTLSQVLAERYLAAEDFENARKFMIPAEWNLRAAGLEQATREAAAAKGGEKARRLLQLGDAWAAQRKKLLPFPLDSEETRAAVFAGEAAGANLFRRENGSALLPKVALDSNLESREELRHALHWWLSAADAQPGSELAATALWRASQALPKIADVSTYTLTRAVEDGSEKEAQRIFDRLRHECPNSREARLLALPWSFPAPPASAYSRSGYQSSFIDNNEITVELADALLPRRAEDYWADEKWKPLVEESLALPRATAAMNAAAFGERARDLQSRVRAQFRGSAESFMVNFADDVALLAEQPAVSATTRTRYLELRAACLRQSALGIYSSLFARRNEDETTDRDQLLREEIKGARAEPAMKPLADFLDSLDLAVVAVHLIDVPIEGVDKNGEPYTYRSRDYRQLEELTRRFLVNYPTSPKQEAALLLHARAVFLLSRPVFYKQWEGWPNADRWEGEFPARYHQREKFNPARVLEALNEYLRAYPKGRYFPELRGYRAEVAARLRDWPRALDLQLAGLADEAHPDLQPAAAKGLGSIFSQLARDDDRAALLDEIKKRPRAKQALFAFLKIKRHDHPLLYLKKYLAAQIGERMPETPAEE